MNLFKRGLLFFSLFVSFFCQVQASAWSDIKKTTKYVISHPWQSTITCAKIGAEGIGSFYSARMLLVYGKNFYNELKKHGIKADSAVIDNQLRQGVVCFGMALAFVTCGKWMIEDIKQL